MADQLDDKGIKPLPLCAWCGGGNATWMVTLPPKGTKVKLCTTCAGAATRGTKYTKRRPLKASEY